MSEALDGRGELVTTQGGTQSISAIQRVSDLGQEAGRSPCRQISDGGVTVRKDDDEECRQGGGGPSRWRTLLCALEICLGGGEGRAEVRHGQKGKRRLGSGGKEPSVGEGGSARSAGLVTSASGSIVPFGIVPLEDPGAGTGLCAGLRICIARTDIPQVCRRK